MNKNLGIALATLGVGLLSACDGDASSGTGTVRVEISGEQAAREGFPVGSGDDEIAFVDGWTLEFHKVLVSVREITLETSGGEAFDLDLEPRVADVHLGEPELWRLEGVPARRWDRVGYRYAPPTAAARKANAVRDEDLERMIEEGLSLYIEATASRGGRSVAIEWGFPFEVVMSGCVNGLDETDGLVVADNATTEAQLTVHLDHLFFDTYASEDAALRFDAMAAVAPADGPLTLDDLARQDNLTDLVDVDGAPLDLAYDPGSTFDPVPSDLRAYVIAAATTTGHFNGEGHCDYAVAE